MVWPLKKDAQCILTEEGEEVEKRVNVIRMLAFFFVVVN